MINRLKHHNKKYTNKLQINFIYFQDILNVNISKYEAYFKDVVIFFFHRYSNVVVMYSFALNEIIMIKSQQYNLLGYYRAVTLVFCANDIV